MTKYLKFVGTRFADTLGITTTALNQKLLGRGGNDVLLGGLGNDKINGGKGNDWISAGAGNDDIDGGQGVDIAVYSGRFSEYKLTFKSNLDGKVEDLVAGRDGKDSLKKVEFLKFSDGIYDIDNDTFQFFNQAPTLSAPAGISYNDTAAHNLFGPSTGALSAVDPNGDTLAYSLTGAVSDNSLAGYNVSKSTGYGTMYLNSATGAYKFVPVSGAIEALKVTSGIDFTFTVSDGEFSDSKTLTVTMNGVNDPASITGDTTDTVIAGSAITADGTLVLHDPDVADQFLLATSSPAGTYGGFMFDGLTGEWSYTVSSDAPNVVRLGAGDTEHDTLTVTSLDGTATVTIDVTVHGVNDSATITGGSAGNVSEDGVLTANGVLTVNDVDSGEEHFRVPLPASLVGTYGSFTFDAASGAWSYVLANSSSAVQGLAAGGDPVHDTLTVTSADGTASRTIDVAIAGNNDQPALRAAVLTGQEPAGDPEAGTASLTLTFTMAFSDIDWTDPHSVTFSALGGGYVGDFTPVVTTNATNGADGLVTVTYHLTQQQVMAAGGFPATQDYLVTIDDHHGGSSSKTMTIPLAEILNGGGGDDGGGHNTNPVIYINPAAGDTASGTVFDLVDHPDHQHLIGRLSFSDAESEQTHTVAYAVGVDSGALGTLGTMFASILRNTDGTLAGPVFDPDGFLTASPAGGVLKWDYTVAENQIRWFGEGETYTDKFEIRLNDDHNGTTTQNVTITIEGRNDLPTLDGDAQPEVLSLGFNMTGALPTPGIHQTHGFGFIDPDRHDTHHVSAVLRSNSTVGASAGTLTAELTKETYFNGPHDEIGKITWTYQYNQAPAAPGQQIWDIFIDDGHGATIVPFTVDFHPDPLLI